MAATIRILNMLLFLGLISQCYGQCSTSDLSINQSQTGAKVQGKSEWSVTITNKCSCVRLNVRLNCAGFQTVEEIDPSILNISGNVCLVNSGRPINRDPFTFRLYSQCFLSDLSLRQSQTGAKVQGKPEWGATITNNCPCVQKNVILNCKGFQTVEHIDPSILSVQGEYCLVKAGQPIYKDAVTFRYAWDTSFPMNPIHSEIDCSEIAKG